MTMRNETILPIAQFLSRVWAEKKLKVRILDIKVTLQTDKNTISIPHPVLFPSSDPVIAYRMWRESLWHEAMHHKCGTFKRTSKFNANEVKKVVLNMIEDYLIEYEGIQIYPGMRREIELSKAVYFELAKHVQLDALGQFGMLLLFGAAKCTYISDCVKEAVEYVKTRIHAGYRNTISMTEKVMKILGMVNKEINSLRYNFRSIAVCQKLNKNDIRNCVEKLQKVKEQQDDENVDIGTDEILKTPEVIQGEFEKIKQEDARIRARLKNEKEATSFWGKKQIMVRVPTVMSDETPYYDMGLITKLRAEMRKIKKGWKENHSDSGEFDVDSYVSGSQKCFIVEEKVKVGGYKVLILLDHSISIRNFEKTYKKSCIALCEALSTLGIQFAVYSFSGPKSNTIELGLIKSFNEKWTRINAKKLASVMTGGSTPLAAVYAELSKVIDGKGKLIFITLTDGKPDLYFETRSEVRKMKKRCKMVAIGFGRGMEVVKLAEDLKGLKYDRCAALDNIKQLPTKVLKLISDVV